MFKLGRSVENERNDNPKSNYFAKNSGRKTDSRFNCHKSIEIDECLKNEEFSQEDKVVLENELVLLHGIYMQFTGHGVILPESK